MVTNALAVHRFSHVLVTVYAHFLCTTSILTSALNTLGDVVKVLYSAVDIKLSAQARATH